MQYDFDTVIDRRGKDAMAVDIPASGKGGHYLAHIQVEPGFDCIPMWIADMNFATAPCIPKALAERSNRTAVDELRTCAPWVREIGDCVRVSNITNAVYQGYHAALDI